MGEVLSFCAREDVLFHRGLKNPLVLLHCAFRTVGGWGEGAVED